MSRSFQIVEDKIEEAELFLNLLEFKDTDFAHFDIRAARFYLSAFLAATRSITFCIRAALADTDGFEEWYLPHQARLRDSELARFFLQARNLSQKVGFYPIGAGRVHAEEDGSTTVELYFDHDPDEDLDFIPQTLGG